MLRLIAITCLLLLNGCASQRPIAEFLAFGDGGYHYDHRDSTRPARARKYATEEQFMAKEARRDWLEGQAAPRTNSSRLPAVPACPSNRHL